MYKKYIHEYGKIGFILANQYVAEIPILKLDLANKEQKHQHDELVKLAGQMIQIQQKINSAKTDLEKENLQKIVNSIDDKIDNIVYKLYNPTEEEIKMIKNNL